VDLRVFEANKNNLSTLPSAVKHLHQLTRMSLNSNRLNKLPQVFWRLSSHSDHPPDTWTLSRSRPN